MHIDVKSTDYETSTTNILIFIKSIVFGLWLQLFSVRLNRSRVRINILVKLLIYYFVFSAMKINEAQGTSWMSGMTINIERRTFRGISFIFTVYYDTALTFYHGALKLDPINFVCSTFSLNVNLI